MTYHPGSVPEDYLFFYKKAHPLSNFHPSPFVAEGILFHTAEQYIMWRKALTFDAQANAAAVLEAQTPAECKELGRQVAGFTEIGWAAVRAEVAHSAVQFKFSQNPPLRDFLQGTGQLILAEASPTDRIWGIGFSAEEAWEHRTQWGQNLLGRVLMQQRQGWAEAVQNTL